jgi:Host cell surface-exposed lipoprotein
LSNQYPQPGPGGPQQPWQGGPQQPWQQQPGQGNQQQPWQSPPQQPWQGGPPPRKKRHVGRNVLIGAASVIVLIGVISAISNSGKPSKAADTPVSVTGRTVAPTTQATTAPVGPTMSVPHEQAVESAKGYLTMGQGFSRYGLLQQLTSSSGEGMARPDALFAIRFLHPNWDRQAVESAKGYLKMGEGFSRSSLFQQLTSTSGEGFTPAQANFALRKVGM